MRLFIHPQMGNRPDGDYPHPTQSQLALGCFPAPYRND